MNITIPIWAVFVVSIIAAVAVTVAYFKGRYGKVGIDLNKVNKVLDMVMSLSNVQMKLIEQWQDHREKLMAESCNRNCGKRRPRDEDCRNQLRMIGLDAFKDELGESKPDIDSTCALPLPPICKTCHAVASCPDRDDQQIGCPDHVPQDNTQAVTESNKEAAESVKSYSATDQDPVTADDPYGNQDENHSIAAEKMASTKKACEESIGYDPKALAGDID
jgi:hypothetical protein